MNVSALGRLPLAARITVPLAAVALLATACSSGSSGGGSSSRAASTPAAASSSVSVPASSAAAPSSSAASAPAAAGATVESHTGSQGAFLTDSAGKSLYLFASDTSTKSTCSAACLTAWPALTTTGAPTAGTGLTASDLGTITGTNGKKQVTYNGHPLYYFAGDSSAGQTNGQGSNSFGALWWLVTPAGAALTTSGGGTGGAASSSTSGGGGGAGGGY